jgi:hypothetical protein
MPHFKPHGSTLLAISEPGETPGSYGRDVRRPEDFAVIRTKKERRSEHSPVRTSSPLWRSPRDSADATVVALMSDSGLEYLATDDYKRDVPQPA